MSRTRGGLEVEDLLKLLLVLVVVWLALKIVGFVLSAFAALLEIGETVVAVAILVLVVLWLLDRI
jgi:hypothetical protein